MNDVTPKQFVTAIRGRTLSDKEMAQEAVKLAELLLEDAQDRQTSTERQQAKKIAGMVDDPKGKALTIALCDQAFRSSKSKRIANQLQHLIDSYGLPSYMAKWEQGALWLGGVVSEYVPTAVVPPFVAKLRQETSTVILPGEEKPLRRYLHKRYKAGTRLNLNQLGEAILGENEAQRRLEAYLKLVARDDVEYISVKISSVFSQINLVAYDQTLELIKERLRTLYRTAMAHTFIYPDGQETAKFINLDMEEYRDLHLTVDAFCQVLDEPEFMTYKAGLVLQAYLPDSFPVQKQLTEWAMNRLARGGAPIKVRIVKGANLAMEKAEASLHGWPQAPYNSKSEVDANFKRMVVYGCEPERVQAVNLGIASHNLFDVAYSLLWRAVNQVESHVEFEMLEGMANHQARAVQECAGGLLLYAPVVKADDFHSAIAYLVRRLDENTAEENFLRDLFSMESGSPAWRKQRDLFLAACEKKDSVRAGPQREQDRAMEEPQPKTADTLFSNVSDTDWSLRQNQKWAAQCLKKWQEHEPVSIPLQVGGELISDSFPAVGTDPSRPQAEPYRYALADKKWVDEALTVAVKAQPAWAAKPISERRDLLFQVGAALAAARGEFLGAMALDGAKTLPEADPEISEAIDFANYYARSLDEVSSTLADCQGEALGVVVVTPPWNFPLAIPVGGVLAALMAGNTVILKPAPEAMLVGWLIAQTLWQAGIPQEVLQFLPCPDNEVGQSLVTDERVAAVILTGSRETARLFQSWKPEMRLLAETSGKNSLIITAMADHDQAIKDLVRSAFGHNGQKCSAASLAICEAEVYDSPSFRRQLKDAVASLKVGSAWNPAYKVTPLTQPPNPALKKAQTTLEPGETWLLEPRMLDGNPRLWSPGIKLGVNPNTFFHQTECFGPVLGLMRATSLQQAIGLANDVPFGLTSGLHSLDDREVALWRDQIEAGNVYINRHITGAIVQRQPFGGWKWSSVGPGAKAGGPNYVFQLLRWTQKELPQNRAQVSGKIDALLQRCLAMLDEAEEWEQLKAAAESYAWAWQIHYGQEHDPSQVRGEANIFRYRPLPRLLLRAEGDEFSALAVCQGALAALTCGTPLTISLPLTATQWSWWNQAHDVTVVLEDEVDLLQRLQQPHNYTRMRVIGQVSEEIRRAANEINMPVLDEPILANGRLELRYYMREQAISHTYHRYGNIIRPPQD